MTDLDSYTQAPVTSIPATEPSVVAVGEQAGLLGTKLHRPNIGRGSVLRPRLLERLNEGLERPLSLICAPAGYGKTVLASQWLESSPHASAWVSLDAGDGRLERFVAYLVAAIEGVFPDVLANTSELLDARRRVPAEVLRTSLVNELDCLPERTIVLLDDFHAVSSEDVHVLVSDLIAHPPQHLHMTLVSRTDPPVGLARVRAHGAVSEVRAADLRLSHEEIMATLTREADLDLSPKAVSALESATEGWPAGVRLAIETWRRRGSTALPLTGVALLDSSYARDFLATEVLDGRPPGMLEHLLASSVLDQFNGPLLDTMVEADPPPEGGRLTGSGFLSSLASEDLFLFALDDKQEWYRYHNLFRDMLRRRVSHVPGRERELHRRAQKWFTAQGMISDALEHAGATGESAEVTSLLVVAAKTLLDQEDWIGLERVLDRFTLDADEAEPELIALEAWLAIEGLADFGRLAVALDRLEGLMERDPDRLSGFALGSLEAMRGFVHYVAGEGTDAARCAKRASELLPSEHARCLAYSAVVEIVAIQMAGRMPDALALSRSTMRDARFRSSAFPPWTWALNYVWSLEADMPRTYRSGSELRRVGLEHGLVDSAANGDYFMGFACYWQDELEAAATHFRAVVEHQQLIGSQVSVHGAAGLALCHVALAQTDEAMRVADSAVVASLQLGSSNMHVLADSLLVEIDLREGRASAAERWLKVLGEPPLVHEYMLFNPLLTYLKARLAVDTEETRGGTNDLLTRAQTFAVRTHNRPLLVQLLGLRSLFDAAWEEEDRVLETLSEAVKLSQPGGGVRLLADLGLGLVRLLNRLDVEGEHLEHVGAILKGISPHPPSGTAQAEGAESTAPIDLPGLEALTRRELDVLTLLARRDTNKEIARELLIAPETVKKHSINVYRKLHVHGRREAVEKAHALGYLP